MDITTKTHILEILNSMDNCKIPKARTKEKYDFVNSIKDNEAKEFALNWVKNQ